MRAVCNVATALVLWLCVSTPSLSAGEFEKPGALARTLALADGSPVHITGLLVDRVVAFPPYAVVRDGQNPNERLIVLFPAPPGLRRWQTVDVAGVLTTLPNGYRAVDKADVTFYTDAMGMPFEVPIPAAGHETAWPFAALTEFLPLAARGEGQARLTESEELPTPEEPPYVAAAGCRSFLDPELASHRRYYAPLAVNGAVETAATSNGLSSFTFPRLKEEFGCTD